ncbi:MAG: hypothetical protein QOE59_4508 [Actinomycetota bacterium]|jgi:hypothetical protein|nr:hypothetical protein [Actinomycetota bacterium]
MTAYALDQDAELDRVVIARAEGILSARHGLTIAEATAALRADARALGVSVVRLADEVVCGAGDPRPTPLLESVRAASSTGDATRVPEWRAATAPVVDLDLDEERALHEESTRRRTAPLDLDAATEAMLRSLLG